MTEHHIDTYFNTAKGRLKLREILGKESKLIDYNRENIQGSKKSDILLYQHDPNEAFETNRPKFEKALKEANSNLIGMLQSSETTIIQGKEVIRQRQKEREENKKYENPIELKND